ncbi:MATE family efflux transporter [Bradyrhizobium sp. JR4.3]|uniref:MATE family efflux transporter n=1 Tax=Bradyrhizobium sp. JR4.3 TaxID=3156373 RepID=UPI00339552BE
MYHCFVGRIQSALRFLRARPRIDVHLAVELRETAKLALPIVLTQVGQIAIMTTDLFFIGRFGTDTLAAAALGGRLYLVSFTFGVGLLAATAPLIAQAFGAHNLNVIRCSLRAGLWVAALLSIPITTLALHGEEVLLALGQRPSVARVAQQYLFGLAWGVAPALCFQVIRSFMSAVNRPAPIWWITLGAVPINALLDCLLIYGKLGLPRSELFGVGLATALVNWVTFSAALCLAKLHPTFRDYHVLSRMWRCNWLQIRQLMVIGIPISIATLMGYAVSLATVLLASRISTGAIAAHQIVAQLAAILFMISYGISTAAALRVSHASGRQDELGVRRAGFVAMLLGIVITAVATVAIVSVRVEISQFFLGDSVEDAPATSRSAAKLLLVGAIFYISDALATIATGALRGLNDTRGPLLIACVSYWCIGIFVGYVLSMKMGVGIVGIWIGLSTGSTVYGGLLVCRFWLLTTRSVLPKKPASA